uniref:Uncharacterized protein SEM0029 n=1 Tax=Synechococcus elongatus (strain ATCC 33912 / PCC 7942 / FACHB-805) TaxID=1140 RepID=Q8GJL2_SYNE7|nr:unknown protein [Synechococcus elongatus PCC 7942 = FACHB-805]
MLVSNQPFAGTAKPAADLERFFMSTSSNFRDAIREAQTSALVGPSVVRRALPFVGGGLVLTSVGVYAGSVSGSNPSLFMPLWIGSIVLQLVLFFVAQGIASRGSNSTCPYRYWPCMVCSPAFR